MIIIECLPAIFAKFNRKHRPITVDDALQIAITLKKKLAATIGSNKDTSRCDLGNSLGATPKDVMCERCRFLINESYNNYYYIIYNNYSFQNHELLCAIMFLIPCNM